MASRQGRRLAIPALAERARTLVTRGRTATVVAAGSAGRQMPMLHQVQRDGSTLLLLAQERELWIPRDPAGGGEVSAMVELIDLAPVVLREPVRGMLWITGWLRVLAAKQGRAAATRWAQHRPDPRLLEVGHKAKLLLLDPVFVVFSDSEGNGWLTPAAVAGAEPDPFCHLEHGWLRHVGQYSQEVLRTAVGLPERGQKRGDAQVCPLGIDRFGLRLRIEDSSQARDVRLAFRHPAATPVQLATELYDLLRCPALAQNTR